MGYSLQDYRLSAHVKSTSATQSNKLDSFEHPQETKRTQPKADNDGDCGGAKSKGSEKERESICGRIDLSKNMGPAPEKVIEQQDVRCVLFDGYY